MKWIRPQACYVYPNPSLSVARGGGLDSPLFSADGRLVCAEYLPGTSGWSIVEDPIPRIVIDGEVFEPGEGGYYGGAPTWYGESLALFYSVAHQAWIIFDLWNGGVPTAYRDWQTGQWAGDGWHESTSLSFEPGRTTTFAPKGTLLNESNPASKTAHTILPRWEWVDDGYSSAPIGKYVGRDGKTGIKYIGAAAYKERGSWLTKIWYRKGEGRQAVFKCETNGEESSAQTTFEGFGRGWGITRGETVYLSATLPSGEAVETFDPYQWDADAGRYVPAEGATPLQFDFHGRTMGRETVAAYFTEVALWR